MATGRNRPTCNGSSDGADGEPTPEPKRVCWRLRRREPLQEKMPLQALSRVRRRNTDASMQHVWQ